MAVGVVRARAGSVVFEDETCSVGVVVVGVLTVDSVGVDIDAADDGGDKIRGRGVSGDGSAVAVSPRGARRKRRAVVRAAIAPVRVDGR